MAPRLEYLLVEGIVVEEGRLPLLASHVDRLATSIKEIGLLEPIVVCRSKTSYPPIVLVAGHHRLEACRKLRMKEIAALVENEDSPAIKRWRALAEIDENLIRRDLTPAQRARLVAKRKAAYEALHPETKKGATGKGRAKVRQVGEANDRFTADTATKSGKSERAVQRDFTRADRLGPDLDRVAGTSLDKGAELDALAGISAEARRPLIDRAVAGERVSAQKPRRAPGADSLFEKTAKQTEASREAERVDIRKTIFALTAQEPPRASASLFDTSDQGSEIGKMLPGAVAWLIEFALHLSLTRHPEDFERIFRAVWDQAPHDAQRNILDFVTAQAKVH